MGVLSLRHCSVMFDCKQVGGNDCNLHISARGILLALYPLDFHSITCTTVYVRMHAIFYITAREDEVKLTSFCIMCILINSIHSARALEAVYIAHGPELWVVII